MLVEIHKEKGKIKKEGDMRGTFWSRSSWITTGA